MNRANDVYFATLTGAEFLDELKTRVTNYRNYYSRNSLASRWSLSLGNKYGVQPDGKTSWRVTMGGENGELVQQKVNDYASYVKHELVLAIQNRPAGIAKAVNKNVKTLRNARIGSQLVEYYLTDPSHAFENDYVRATNLALLTGEAFVVQDWDTGRGEEVRPDELGGTIRQGDISQYVYPVWDAARDIGSPTLGVPWYIFSRRTLKFELSAKFDAFNEEIVSGSDSNGIAEAFMTGPEASQTDYIEEFLFIHLPTLALPQGRYTRFTADCIFMDVPYPYKSSNVHRVIDEELIGTSFGHTANYDLLGLEQVTDCLHSIILNNQSTFGVATLMGVKGNGITQQDIAKGMRYFEVDPAHWDKIKVLDLVRTSPEIFNYLQMLGNKKGEMSGINSILRGDPQGALKGASGSAMALLQSQAIVFNSGPQRSFYGLLSSAGTGIIEMCREFADEPRIVRISGKSNAQAVKEFKYDSSTLESISTVVFEPVNPVMQTAAGKLAVAQDLLKMPGMITSPKRYIEVLTTGNLETFIGDDTAMQDAILEENEFLMEGRKVMALVTENHEDHIKGHQAVLAEPNSKEDPELVARTLAHIQEHVNQWTMLSQTNPALLLATGQKVLPPQAPPGMGGAPGGPGGGAGPGPAGVANPQSSEAPGPSLPKPPTNPATGEDAIVAPGTSVRQAA